MMFVKRTEFDKIQKRLAEYRKINYELQLENETLRECVTTDKKEEEMRKERTKLGDIIISKATGKPILCTGVEYNAKGDEDSTWVSYETNLLKTQMGMSPESHQLHPLQYFVDVLDANRPIGQKDSIKIRYVYIISPTNMKLDPGYYETLVFTVLTLEELEGTSATLEELLTQDEAVLIKILGRDVCTDRDDMDNQDIYSSDIIRWVGNEGERDEIVTPTTNFYELETSKDCKVIGTIYDKEVI